MSTTVDRLDAGCDVAIVGAGPVGQLLALLLGRLGRRVELLERRPEPYPLPRAVHLDHEASRILQSAGVMAALAPFTEAMDAYEWQTAGGQTLLRFGIPGVPGRSGWPESSMFSQPDLEGVLAAELAAVATATLRRGCDVVGLRQAPDSVELTIQEGGQRATRRARWVVGCDGANGRVGEMVGARYEDLGYSSDWLVLDILPREVRAWHPLNVQVCDPLRPTTAVSGGPGRRRWEFMRLADESQADLDRPERAWELLGPWGMTPENAVLERQAMYTFSARLALDWAVGRVALAGDAAHQMPPFAGQGLCCGLRDAANLAWKLDLLLDGDAPSDLLDTYGRERAPQVRAAIDFSIALGGIICVSDPVEAAARDEAMVAAVIDSGPIAPPPPPPIGPGVTRPEDPQAGQLGCQGMTTHLGRRGLFDDVVGAGWVLLGAGTDPLTGVDDELRRWWIGIGGRAVAVTAAPGPADSAPADWVADSDGTYAQWFQETGASVILQRPDFYVFGTALDVRGTDQLLGALRTALTTVGAGS